MTTTCEPTEKRAYATHTTHTYALFKPRVRETLVRRIVNHRKWERGMVSGGETKIAGFEAKDYQGRTQKDKNHREGLNTTREDGERNVYMR
jgi:hypothetical protein